MTSVRQEDNRRILDEIEKLQVDLRREALRDVDEADLIRRRIDYRMEDLRNSARESENVRRRAEAGALIGEILSQPVLVETAPEIRRSFGERILGRLLARTGRQPTDIPSAVDHPLTDDRSRESALQRLRHLIDMSLDGEPVRVVALDLNAGSLRRAADLCTEVARHMSRDFAPAERIACASDATRALLRNLEHVRVTCVRSIERTTPEVPFDGELRIATMFAKSVEHVEGVTYRVSDDDLRDVADRLEALGCRLRSSADAISREAWRIRLEAVEGDGTPGVRASDLAKAVSLLGEPVSTDDGEPE